MFIRFKEVPSGGIKPDHVRAKKACATACGLGQRPCPMRPRCRWRVAVGDARLDPYRLQVSIAHTSRSGGKVRQERVGSLGAIDGHMLASFHTSSPPDDDVWRRELARARFIFWKGVLEHLARLGNRIDAATAERLKHQVAERIPMPTAAESASVDLWAAQHELDMARTLRRSSAQQAAGHRHTITVAQRKAAECDDVERMFQHGEAHGAARLDRAAAARLALMPKSDEDALRTAPAPSKDDTLTEMGVKLLGKQGIKAAIASAELDTEHFETVLDEAITRANRKSQRVIDSAILKARRSAAR